MQNRLILGDNLEILKSLPSESVDLIYIDPPFFSNRNYEVIWGDKGEVRSFQDRWQGGVDHYISWLYERVEQMYRVLKKTGSMYLHCDWHADAYIRVYIMDKIFGQGNFKNHIIWKRTGNPKGSQFEKKQYGVATDSLFWYSKGKKYYFDEKNTRIPLPEEDIQKKYPKADDKGRYYEYPILRSASKGARPNLVYEYKGFTPPFYGWVVNQKKLKEIDQRGDLGWRQNGQPFRKFRPSEDPGKFFDNIWDDIQRVQSNSNEAIGYPTQKPEALLERIIKASSNEGDVVLDAFVGGGTTVAVADRIGRKWIGIDQSVMAIKVSESRLHKQRGLFSAPFEVKLHKYDYDTLRYSDAFEFEKWIVEQFQGEPNEKQRGDFGLDGKKNGVPIQVKRSDAIGRNVVDNFKSAVERFRGKRQYEKNEIDGYIIAFSFGKGAYQEVARLKNEEGFTVELITVESIIPIAKKPKMELNFEDLGLDSKNKREISFTAKADAEIEFFQWCFNYKEADGFQPDVMIDKKGEALHKFEAGEYEILCKAVDFEGIETQESMRLKVNGVTKRLDVRKSVKHCDATE